MILIRDESVSLTNGSSVLSETEAIQFQTTFDLVSTALLLLDSQGLMLKVNPAFGELLGYAAADVIGESLLDLLHPEDRDNLKMRHGQVLPGILAGLRLELRCRHRAGHYCWGWLTASVATSGESAPRYIVVQIENINHHKVTLEQLALVNFALSHMREAAYVVDEQTRFCYVNEEACRALGYSRAELLTMGVADIDPDWPKERVLERFQRIKEGPAPLFETRHQTKSGRIFPVEISDSHFAFAGHSYSLALARDISERKRMQEQLLSSERQFRTLAENSPNIIIRYHRDYRRSYVNPAFAQATGIPLEQALHTSLEDTWSTQIPATKYLQKLHQVMESGDSAELLLEWPHPQTCQLTSHLFHLVAERGADGQVIGVLAKGHNVTILKRHERLEEARLSIFERLAKGAPLEEVLERVVRYMEEVRPDFNVGIMLADRRGQYLFAGPSPSLPADYVEGLGQVEIGEGAGTCGTASWRAETVIAEDLRTSPYYSDLHKPAIQAGVQACWSEPILDSSGKVLGTFGIYRRQTGRPSAEDLKLVRQASHLAAIAIERKYAEALVQESERRYREIFDGTLDALILVEATEDGRFRTLEVNPAFEHKLGRSRSELIGKTIEEIEPAAVAAKITARYRRCLVKGTPIDEEQELELPTGHLTFHSTLIPVQGAGGRIQRIIGISRDITQSKHAERTLHAREQEFRALVENTPDIIARFDLECRFLYANPAAQALLKRPLTELLGKTATEIAAYSAAGQSFADKLGKVVGSGEATEEEFNLDATPKYPEPSSYQVRFVQERDPHGRLTSVLAVGRDLSARRAAERRLAESHEQLRRLASHRENAREEERKRIAREIHDELGQQLTALRMGISLLRLQFGEDNPPLVERVGALKELADKTIQVVRNVATSLRPAALDMGLASALEWLIAEFSKNAGVPCQLSAPGEKLILDDERATAAFRVVQESLTNVARHAQASWVDIQLERSADYVLIVIRDNGKGFDSQKPRKGTLGLLGMHERGYMLGGEVLISSTPGRGTTVQVRIPIQGSMEKS